jgi:putative aldouronate transport system substrate-binding protein
VNRNWKSVTLVLAAALVTTSLSACSSNNKNGNNSSNEGTATNAASTEKAAESPEGQTLKPYKITMALPVFGAIPKDIGEVQAELNKITTEKINATVEILPISIGSYVQQMNLMYSGGEKLDLAFTFASGGLYASTAATGKFLQIDDLLKEYGQGIIQAVGEDFINIPQIDGKLYGTPTVDVYAKGTAYYMRQDLVDKYKINVDSIKTLDDIENVLKTIKDNEPNMIPLAVAAGIGPVFSYKNYDDLGNRIGVLPGYDNGLKVTNLFETQDYADQLERVRGWFKAGYINKDASTTTQQPSTLLKAGNAFSFIYPYNHTSLGNLTNETGYKLAEVELIPPYSTSADAMSGLWTIAQNSENPERAMMLLNLMYTDKDIANLLTWGIEGKHYVKVSDTQADFPKGVDAGTVGYNLKFMDWVMGNASLTYLSMSNDPNQLEMQKAFKERAIHSKALGFTFNEEPVKNEGVALKNVMDQYAAILDTGTVDPEKKLKEFNDKLKAAGLEKYIAEKQKQLDAWVAANK